MKQLKTIIESLKVNSKSKVQSDIRDICNCLHCNEQAAIKIRDEYATLNILSKQLQDKMICSDFEALFMLASMLVDDNKEPKNIIDIGTIGYKKNLHGNRNPYDYSWFEEWYDEDNDIDVLQQIKNEYQSNKKIKDKFIEIFDFCKINDITEADDIFAFQDEVDIRIG